MGANNRNIRKIVSCVKHSFLSSVRKSELSIRSKLSSEILCTDSRISMRAKRARVGEKREFPFPAPPPLRSPIARNRNPYNPSERKKERGTEVKVRISWLFLFLVLSGGVFLRKGCPAKSQRSVIRTKTGRSNASL